MKLRRLCALLLSFAMLLSLLSGCGGKESEEDGRGDVISEEQDSDPGDGRGDAISEEQGSDPGDTLDEPEVNFEDFFGCWEYWDYDIWLYVYGDGTYEMYHENGDCTAGSYTPEGTEIVLDSGERFALNEEGGLIDEDGNTLFPAELPDFTPVAYFEERGYSFDLEMDEGRFPLEDAARYYYSDGSYYTTVYAEWGLKKISDTVVSDQYREIVFQASCYFPHSSNPGLSGSYIVGCTSQLFDYYTGECLPIASIHGDSSAEENTYSYTLNINGEEVRIDYMKSVSWEDYVGDCRSIAHQTITVRMPVDYDGLVFCASPSPYTYEECMASDLEAEGYFTGLTLEERIGIDEDNALFCRIR